MNPKDGQRDDDSGTALTEREKRYLAKIETRMQRFYINYITVGILACGAVLAFFRAVRSGDDRHVYWSIIFAISAIAVFGAAQTNRRRDELLLKLKKHIHLNGVSYTDTTPET